MFFAVGDGPALLDAEVVNGEDVRAAEAEDQEHFDGPGADAADGDKALDEFFVGHFFRLFERGDDAVDGLLREVLHGENFCAGETCFAERGPFEFKDFLGSGNAAGGAEGFDATKDGGGGFAGDGLVGNGFEENLVGAVRAIRFDAELLGFFDQPGKLRVFCSEGVHSEAQVEWRHAEFLSHMGSIPDTRK